LLILTPLVRGQGDAREDLSQQAANPLADLLSFPFQNRYRPQYKNRTF
jgi:hypothetical protein